jgi:hypothetical protein
MVLQINNKKSFQDCKLCTTKFFIGWSSQGLISRTVSSWTKKSLLFTLFSTIFLRKKLDKIFAIFVQLFCRDLWIVYQCFLVKNFSVVVLNYKYLREIDPCCELLSGLQVWAFKLRSQLRKTNQNLQASCLIYKAYLN